MTISNEAVEAATKAFIEEGTLIPALEAAAGIIRAECLEEAADKAEALGIAVISPSSLHARAATERGQAVSECACVYVTDEKYWARHGHAIEPYSSWDADPDCVEHRAPLAGVERADDGRSQDAHD
jgi:hypothetical protein